VDPMGTTSMSQLGTASRPAARTPASSVAELVAGATSREPFHHPDGKSGSRFERVVIEGRPHVLKLMHVDDDWIARSLGDLGCRQVTVWASGLLDLMPPTVDHAVVGAARGFGRNGWGAALLLRDVGDRLVPEGDDVVPAEQHAAFLDRMAELAAHLWGWTDDVGLTPPSIRWTFCGPGMLAVERGRGWPDEVPAIAERGWRAFAERAPADVRAAVDAVRHEPQVLVDAVATTPWTFLHGDWKMGNLGSHADGRTILLDWAYPGAGPACHDLGWYLATNRARLPEPKEAAVARFRRALAAHGVDTEGWWDRQLDLCLLGTVVQLGWEKALGDVNELGWWTDRAREGARHL
jgi:Phosphotransferase enzyme family